MTTGNGRHREPAAYDHFAAINRLVDSGALAKLSRLGALVWICYFRHAGPTGESWPSNGLLAVETGQTGTSHLRRARQELIKLSLLERVDTGGGTDGRHHHTSIFRVLMPPLREIGAGVRKRRRDENGAGGCAKSGHTPARISPPPYKEEQLIERHNGTTKRTSQLRVSDSECDSIYREYPKRRSPEYAYKAIRKAIPIIAKREGISDPVEWLRGRVKAYAAARQRICEADPAQKRFTPYLASWLNARGFDEDPAEWDPVEEDPKANENGFVRCNWTDAELDELLETPGALTEEIR